ncbi:MAG: aldehyde dehydrogenase family protein [Acidobacteriota bacterium]
MNEAGNQVLSAWIGGKAVPAPASTPRIELFNPVDGSLLYRLPDAGEAMVDAAVRDAAQAFAKHRRSTAAMRIAWLEAIAKAVEANPGPLAETIMRGIGKPRRAANFEVGRVAEFVRGCIAELLTWRGELLPVDSVAQGAGRIGMSRRIPYGVVVAVTPFNAPANLLMQKLAPALAAGNAVVVKPHPAATETTLLLAELCSQAGLPDGMFNVVPGERKAALALAAHAQVSMITFTGGVAAAEALARAAGAKKFCAELGSNAANIVLADANLEDAAQKIARAAFEASGQQCISAQRVIVEISVFDRFLALFVEAAKSLKVGAPADPSTDIGPMVNAAAAERIMDLVKDAVERGARVALMPERQGATVSPAILMAAPPAARLLREEAFGPVVVVQPAKNIDDAIAQANDSQFGLQGACFTRSLDAALRMAEEFDAGALWINEASRFRLDMYPFGGVKASGYGREGIRYAMEECSQWKFVGLKMSA